jgi:hypothetical protein
MANFEYTHSRGRGGSGAYSDHICQIIARIFVSIDTLRGPVAATFIALRILRTGSIADGCGSA